MKSYIASIDVGTTNVKINLFNSNYQLIDSYKSSYSKIKSNDQIFEMDMDEIWQKVVEGLRELTRHHPIEAIELILTTAMHSLQLMDTNYQLIGSLLTWADKRGSEALAKMTDEEKHQQYLRTATPNHSMNPNFKLRDYYQSGKFVGSMKDILFYRLTGEWAIDLSNASSSGLLNIETLSWDPQSLTAIGMSETQLPTIHPVDYRAQLKDGIVEVEGVVTIGTSDGISSNYVFNDLEGVAVLSIGTSHAVRVVHTLPLLNTQLQNFSYVINPNHHLIGLPSNNGADVLAWAVRIFNATYEELDQIAVLRPETDSIFLPYLNGERAPIWNECASGNLFNLSRTSTRESILFSIILGMLFNIKQNVVALRSLVDFESLGLVGGITKLPAVIQLLADVLGYPLHIPQLENAETLGSIALVKGKTFKKTYKTLTPSQDMSYDSLYHKYLKINS
ncbi:gluconokinase [Aerococcaceae bacterium WGS1372]